MIVEEQIPRGRVRRRWMGREEDFLGKKLSDKKFGMTNYNGNV